MLWGAAGLALACGAVSAGGAQAATAPAASVCSTLAAPGAFDHTTVTSAVIVPADPANGTPAFCEVTGVISPVQGSAIGVVYRLPEGWNGKMLGLGGGGWAGNIRIETAAPGLKAGYATAQTDAGHDSRLTVWDLSWATNPEALTDFAYRAVHQMTAVGKEVVARYYGRPQTRAYFQGCSTGGRQGLMEVQRFPDDYDGVISGAPVYNLTVQTSAIVRDNIFAGGPEHLTPETLALAHRSVLADCDAKDGVADGIITDPRACDWDPASIQCKPGEAGAECLTAGQVAILQHAYRGVQTMDGRVAAWPLSRGGEEGWGMFMPVTGGKDATNGGGIGGLKAQLLGDPDFDMAKFDPSVDLAKVRTSAFARIYEANDPAIGAFTGHGGKLLMWHGFYDPGPSPIATISYFDQVQGSAPNAAADTRLFLAPGVYHCGGGPGPDRIDLLAALDQWVETGRPPETLLATKAGAKISRPLCAYPAMPRYKGAGDPDAASSFECR
ncbi:MAG: tannase/feruloyl esterase family alpha/beta hydrolase [Caulobacteraceae bacterium]